MIPAQKYQDILMNLYQDGILLVEKYPDDTLATKDIRWTVNNLKFENDSSHELELLEHAAFRAFEMAQKHIEDEVSKRVFNNVNLIANDGIPDEIFEEWTQSVIEAHLVLAHDWGLYNHFSKTMKVLDHYCQKHIHFIAPSVFRLRFLDLTYDNLSEEAKRIYEYHSRLLQFHVHPKFSENASLTKLRFLNRLNLIED